MARDSGQVPATRVIAIVAVSVLAIGVSVLAVLAYQRANPTLPSQTAEAVPSFDLGVQTQTPTPTPTAEPEPEYARATERFLTVRSGTMWRATAGACNAAEPLIERSTDGGGSWVDVTPRYLGIAQVASLDGLAVDAVEAVSALGADCGTRALRSFTNGEFWADFPDVLALSRYVDVADPAVVHLGPNPVAAPCAVAHGLRALRETVALVCDDIGYVWRDDRWTALPGAAAVAVSATGGDIVSAHVTAECAGLTLTRFSGGDPAAGTPAGCAQVTDAAAPAAIAANGDALLVWSGDELVTAPGR